jgi:hypothetical protein
VRLAARASDGDVAELASKAESNDLKELLEVAREYITATRIKDAMTAEGGGDKEGANPTRSLELAAYFTHCNLQPSHLMLALKTAMVNAFKNKVRLYIMSFFVYCPCLMTSRMARLGRISSMQRHLLDACWSCQI